ncbi:MAG: FHA domain-containing protein [Planctomycetes bacterium]|nr:FHA domain-containing protein [Planctomycetota bacterium]
MSSAVAKLIGQKEPVKDQEILCSGPITFGRDPTANSFPINHPSISRKHGRIFQDGSAWSVEDLGSSNGTYLNEVRIQKVRLKDGDVVRFGDVPFKFNMARPEPPPQQLKATAPGFEPTLMMAAAEKPRVDASPPSDFEGTVFGGQAPVFFANQMQRDQAQQAAGAPRVAQADSPAPVYAPPPPPQVPNVFLLKIKAFAVIAFLFSLLAIGVIWLIYSSGKEREVKEAIRSSRAGVEDFVSNNETRVLQADVRIATFQNEVGILEKMLGEVKEKIEKFNASRKEEVDQLKTLKERVEFLIFERKLVLKVDEDDREGADRLVQEMAVNGTEDQKTIAPLAKELLRFQQFRKNFPLKPSQSQKTPERKEIDALTASLPVLKSQYEKCVNNQLVFNTHFALMAQDSIDNDEALIRLWKKYYENLDEIAKTTDADQRKALVEKLKKDYPNLDSIKNFK